MNTNENRKEPLPKFGPSGNSDLFYELGYRSSYQTPQWLREIGLDAYEYSFGHGVRIKQETAELIGKAARENGITMSVHAPYFINLSAPEEEKFEKNIGYFHDTLQAAHWFGATRMVFHPGSAKGRPREEALEIATAHFKEILCLARQWGYGEIALCPETMGKINQLGDLPEVLALCKVDERVVPTIDFGHLHSRDMGAIQTKADYEAILDAIANALGEERLLKIHVHFGRIEFTKGGEKRHWTFADTQFGPDFQPLAELLAERKMAPTIICESSGTMAQDALAMKEMYYNARSAHIEEHISR